MVLAGNDDRLKLINDAAVDIKDLQKRVERLETLEFDKAAKGYGCISWLDFDDLAMFQVDVPANPFELGDYGWTHLTAWFGFISTSAGNKTLQMTYNAIAANYSYHYRYSYGAVPAVGAGAADGAAFIVVGNLYGSTNWTTGMVHVPLFPVPIDMGSFGWWEAHDSTRELGTRQERGDFAGRVTSGIARVTRLTFVPSAGAMSGYLYLYGWCPTWDIATGPPD